MSAAHMVWPILIAISVLLLAILLYFNVISLKGTRTVP
jgi:hypothetical protein